MACAVKSTPPASARARSATAVTPPQKRDAIFTIAQASKRIGSSVLFRNRESSGSLVRDSAELHISVRRTSVSAAKRASCSTPNSRDHLHGLLPLCSNMVRLAPPLRLADAHVLPLTARAYAHLRAPAEQQVRHARPLALRDRKPREKPEQRQQKQKQPHTTMPVEACLRSIVLGRRSPRLCHRQRKDSKGCCLNVGRMR